MINIKSIIPIIGIYKITSPSGKVYIGQSIKGKPKPKDFGKNHSLKMKDKGNIPINQYDLQGKFLKEWKSSNAISEYLGIINGSSITLCCKERHRKTAYGFIWKYKNLVK